MSKLELIAGGTRSGKSRYAQSCAEDDSQNRNLVFVATAQAGDQEMMDRIQKHQQKRDEKWSLIEAPKDLASVVNRAGEKDCLLIDCLTLWVTNWLVEYDEAGWIAQKNAFLEALQHTAARIIMVTNEVGIGITPMAALSRRFIDESGWLHQAVASLAEQVTLVVFGLPQKIK